MSKYALIFQRSGKLLKAKVLITRNSKNDAQLLKSSMHTRTYSGFLVLAFDFKYL